jgi:hypothetical protein
MQEINLLHFCFRESWRSYNKLWRYHKKHSLLYKNYAIAVRIATNMYNSGYGPKPELSYREQAPTPDMLKFLGDVADALHNLEKGPYGPARFYEAFYEAQKVNAAWNGQLHLLRHRDIDLAPYLYPLPTGNN